MWGSVELESISSSSTSLPTASSTTSEVYTGRRLERFVNSWEGVLEESVDETEQAYEDSFRLRVSVIHMEHHEAELCVQYLIRVVSSTCQLDS